MKREPSQGYRIIGQDDDPGSDQEDLQNVVAFNSLFNEHFDFDSPVSKSTQNMNVKDKVEPAATLLTNAAYLAGVSPSLVSDFSGCSSCPISASGSCSNGSYSKSGRPVVGGGEAGTGADMVIQGQPDIQ
jgi:hypothetical protein